MFFLDTNTCIYALEGPFREIRSRVAQLLPERIKVPSMVLAELLFGAAKSRDPDRTRRTIEDFVEPYEIIAFGGAAAAVHAEIRAELEGKGTPIGPNDLIIAATALAANATLVTHNTQEFARVSGLKLQDWAQ